MDKQTKENILQQGVPFSQCDLWKLQREFFEQQGINAWVNQVPFYITSNPYIANSYAQIILQFMQDCISNKRYNALEPFYILELATGSGTFSFYIIKQLLKLRQDMDMEHIPFVYVMTDFTINNIQYWQQHPMLQDYVAQGILDFAQYDMEVMQPIKLVQSGISLKRGAESPNPLIVIANYAFDTVSHDVFNIKNGELAEGLARVSTPDTGQQSPIDLNNINVEFSYRPANNNYYADSNLNEILLYYTRHYNDINLLLPIGSLRCIQNLQQLSQSNLLLLATDKGYSNHVADFNAQDPTIAWHGSVSLMVNFDAIGQYFKQCGGDFYYQTLQQEIVSCAFVLGQTFKTLKPTKHMLLTHFDQFGPGNLFNFYHHISATKHQCKLTTLLSYLNATLWDPQIFDELLPYILTLVEQSDETTVKDLLLILPKIAANFYYVPGGANTLLNIGILLQKLGKYSEALNYFQQILQDPKQHVIAYYNMGLCYFYQNDYGNALAMFQHAKQLQPKDIMLNGWLLKLESELKLQPIKEPSAATGEELI
jgi:tetratricopeptide (TPR) repeat protein